MIPFFLSSGANMSHIEGWKYLIVKFIAKFSNWKVSTLSFADSGTKLKSVSGSIEI